MLAEMWSDLKHLFARMFEAHTTRKIGFVVGVIIGISILNFGLFSTLFAIFCGIIGLYIGSRFEEKDTLVVQTLKALEYWVPERFRYWKYFS